MYLNREHIICLAKRRGMTQSQLASELGVSKSGLSNTLSGRRGASPTVIIGLMRIFPNETLFTICQDEGDLKK